MVKDLNKGIVGASNANGILYNHLNLPEEVKFGSTNKIKYIYDANGVKLVKQVIESGKGDIFTYYAGNYVYEGSALSFFGHGEGYVEPVNAANYSHGFDYVYQYKDVWGNNRLSYSDLNNDGAVDSSEIIEDKNYYPFGLEHKGYNNILNGTEHNWKFQNQEFTENLGLDMYEYKFRMHDPAIGRFMQIDPLAEHYVYNSTYAFQENKLGIGVELEGLEVSRHEWIDKEANNHIDYTADIKIINNSSASQKDIISFALDIANRISTDFSGTDADGNIITTSVRLEFVNEVDYDFDYVMEFTNEVKDLEGNKVSAEGKVDVIGNSEVNRMQILIPGKSGASYSEPVTVERVAINGAHEYGHTLGLNHQVGSTYRDIDGIPVEHNNLMRNTNEEYRQQGGLNSQQLKVLKNNVKNTYQINQNKWNRQKAKENKRQKSGKF